MVQIAATQRLPNSQVNTAFLAQQSAINANDVDAFVTAEPTPKMESRRGWRRRRVRRGKT